MKPDCAESIADKQSALFYTLLASLIPGSGRSASRQLLKAVVTSEMKARSGNDSRSGGISGRFNCGSSLYQAVALGLSHSAMLARPSLTPLLPFEHASITTASLPTADLDQLPGKQRSGLPSLPFSGICDGSDLSRYYSVNWRSTPNYKGTESTGKVSACFRWRKRHCGRRYVSGLSRCFDCCSVVECNTDRRSARARRCQTNRHRP